MTTRRMSAAFPEVAQIRKGGPKEKRNKNGRNIDVMGPDLNDHFRVIFFPGAEAHQQAFLDVYKTYLPDKIRAMVPFPSVWDAWRVYNEAYNAGRMVAQADDDQYITLRDPVTGEYKIRNGEPFKKFTPGDTVSYEGRNGKQITLKLKSYGNLRLFLPEIGALVAFTLKTTSYYDRIFIEQQLGAIQAVANALSGGNAAGIPFYVYRTLRDVTRNMPDGSAVRTNKWLVTIEADQEYVKEAIKRMSNFALTGQSMAMLTPGEMPVIEGTIDPDLDDDYDEDDENIDVAGSVEYAGSVGDGDVVESQFADEAPAPSPDPVVSSGEKKIARPYPPEVVKAKLQAVADDFADNNLICTQPQRNLLRMCLEQCFAGDKEATDKRKTISFWLTGSESTKDIPDAWVVAMLDRWLSPKQDSGGDYQVNHFAIREAQSILKNALKAEGQAEMEL